MNGGRRLRRQAAIHTAHGAATEITVVYSPNIVGLYLAVMQMFLSRRPRLGASSALLATVLWYGTANAAVRRSFVVPPGWPQVLSVPRLSVVAKIEPVAMTNITDVEAPHRMDEVAWYSRGHRPGDRGRAELFGHLDSVCCPAVFYRLRDMKPGDLVQVRYRTGNPLTFRVRWQHTYPRTTMPLTFMYGPTTDHGLMLVTCAGTFHHDGTGYDQRLMVYATVVP